MLYSRQQPFYVNQGIIRVVLSSTSLHTIAVDSQPDGICWCTYLHYSYRSFTSFISYPPLRKGLSISQTTKGTFAGPARGIPLVVGSTIEMKNRMLVGILTRQYTICIVD